MKYEEAKQVEAGLDLRLNLRQKLLRIMEHVGNVPKEGHNTQGAGYTYQKIADMLPKVQAACILQGVIFRAMHESTTHHETHESRNGAQIFVTSVVMYYEFLDTESEECIGARQGGYAFDTSDKAENKAKTAALKYFLKQTFLIGEEDDDSEKDTLEVKKEADGGRKKEGKVEGVRGVPALGGLLGLNPTKAAIATAAESLGLPAEAPTRSETISPGDINDMLAALTSAAGIWGTDYIAGCLKTWAARPVPNIDKLGQDGAVDVALIDSLTENDHQVSKFHGRLKKLQTAVEKVGVTV